MKVLVVDPDPDSRDALRRALSAAGGQVRGFASAAEARRHLSDFAPDVVVAALDLPEREGEAFLAEASAGEPRRAVWALVPEGRLEDAIAAIGNGADDFLWRPVSAARACQLLEGLRRVRAERELAEETRLKVAHLEAAAALPGRSPRWVQAMAAIERLAGEKAILVTGEEGTEKEAAARFLHRLSPRGAGPFVKAAEGVGFRDALARAGTGTVFVTGVDRIAGPVQEQVLEALEDPAAPGLVLSADRRSGGRGPARRPRGGHRGQPRGCVVDLPPLRERGRRRHPAGATSSWKTAAARSPSTAEAIDVLTAHDWPGNVTELSEAVRRAARLVEGPTIGATVVPSVIGRPLAARGSRRRKVPVVRIAVGDSLADVERRLIQKTLDFARGNKRKTAELLKLSLKTIYNKIKEYGLEH